MRLRLSFLTLGVALLGSTVAYGANIVCPQFKANLEVGWRLEEGSPKPVPGVTYVPYDVLIFDASGEEKAKNNVWCRFVPKGTSTKQVAALDPVRLTYAQTGIYHSYPPEEGGGYIFIGGNAPSSNSIKCSDNSSCWTQHMSLKSASFLRCLVNPGKQDKYTNPSFPKGCEVLLNPKPATTEKSPKGQERGQRVR